ncbi:hypothetical protein CYMTET_27469 [Cymbomonas tetramitiformis]|uniref:Uncharacterized protein n=1 Tax=Cymbomonas tetramitiformis TaxID=36881 RepID=A0AAE0FRB8_9CHLO|nr:hypothetical protein CYMTET_27469 [Cymbomonas tetramitiformis]
MVASTRATASMANRRRALSTIFDSAAARHANTPATPPAAQPAANSAGATFLASVRTLQREHFDMKVSKTVRQKLFEDKNGRFSGTECHASALFARMVSALQTAFVTEDIGFAPLFLLDDATLPVRVEANSLLFSALELMVDPSSPAADWMDSSHSSFPSDGKRVLLEFARRMIPAGDPFQGQADMLSIRISAGVDPHDKIGDFNAALKAARTRATLLDEDVKALFIKALDTAFYQPVVSRLLLHDQRAAHDLLTIQQWVRECYSEHVRAGTATASAHRYSHGTHFMGGTPMTPVDPPSTRGYTPRADKPDRRIKTRFATTPLPKGGYWSQSVSKKVAFHRDTGATVPYCQNQVCAKGKARHWHRDCPNGGRTGLSAYAFAEEAENSVLAAKFQHAIDRDDAEEFDALCMLAGGKPDIFADLSACSFCEEDGEALVSAVTEFSELARTAGASTFSVNTFTADMPVVSGPVTHSPPASVESDEEWTGPPNPFCPPVTRTFADFIENTGIALGAPGEPPVSMNLLSAVEAPESVMGYEPASCVTSDDDDEHSSVALPQPRYGCGRGIPGFGGSLLTSSLVGALFVICAAAAPHTISGVGGADARACTAPPVGGAAWTASAVPTAATSPPAPFRDDPGDAVGGAVAAECYTAAEAGAVSGATTGIPLPRLSPAAARARGSRSTSSTFTTLLATAVLVRGRGAKL